MVHCSCLLFAAVIIVNGMNVASGQTQVDIGASKDNTLIESATGALSNGAGGNFFVGRTGQPAGSSIRRGVIAFDIAGNIPSGATITSVILTLSMSRTIAGAQTVSLHAALADWGEGTSVGGGVGGGAGGPSTTNDATWIHTFFDTLFWTTPGGDFSPTPSGSQTVSGLGSYTWGSTAGMVADVQQWLDTPSTNFGWVVVGNESAGFTAKRFDTKENANAAARPKLTVTYSPLMHAGDIGGVPGRFRLEQNYPNPFNPSTTIRFAIERSSHVTLKIYNLLGQEVATLLETEKPAGEHTVEWNAAGLTGGVYVYRLQANGFSSARKLVLLK